MPTLAFGPSSHNERDKHQAELHGIDQVISISSRFSTLWTGLARLGNNITGTLGILVSITEGSLIENNVCGAKFCLESSNGLLCGSTKELMLNGLLYCMFDDNNKIISISLVYDTYCLHNCLKDMFGQDLLAKAIGWDLILSRDVEKACEESLSHEIHQSTLVESDSYRYIVTNSEDTPILLDSDRETMKLIGGLDGKTLSLSSSGAENNIMSRLRQRKTCIVDSIDISSGHKFAGVETSLQSSLLIVAIPLDDCCVHDASCSTRPASAVLWCIRKCQTSQQPLLVTLAHNLLHRVVLKYEPLLAFPTPPKDYKGFTVLLPQARKYRSDPLFSVLYKAAIILTTNDCDVVVQSRKFIKWVFSIDQKNVNFDAESLITIDSNLFRDIEVDNSLLMNSFKSSAKNTPFESETDRELLSFLAIQNMSKDVSTFFMQIRSSKLMVKLIPFLQIPKVPQELRSIEQYIWFCWSKHTSDEVQELIVQVKKFMEARQNAEAHVTLSKVIALDPLYAEAYNKRATVNFLLKSPAECFADVATVLSIEPLHYGAMCGKAFMYMQLKNFPEALAIFDDAVKLNPLLNEGGVSESIAYCKQFLAPVQADKQNALEKQSCHAHQLEQVESQLHLQKEQLLHEMQVVGDMPIKQAQYSYAML